VAALSRHPAHALGSYFAVSGVDAQQEIYVRLCRTCGGWNFFVESEGKRGKLQKDVNENSRMKVIAQGPPTEIS